MTMSLHRVDIIWMLNGGLKFRQWWQ